MKMDKREIILCLLFGCLFLTMIFIRAFAADAADPVNVTTFPRHGKQSALEILEDDSSYNSWLDNLRSAGADVASNVWSSASDMARNLLAYGVGCVANVSEEVLQVAFPDLEHYLGDMYFDWDRLEWEFTNSDDVEDFIKTGLDPYEYSIPDSTAPVVGYWYPVGVSSDVQTQSNGSKQQNKFFSTFGDVYVCAFASGNYTCFCFASKSLESRSAYIERYYDPTGSSGLSLYATYNFNLTNSYSSGGSVVGYYRNSSQNYTDGSFYGNYGIANTRYSNLNAALLDFFGQDWVAPSPDPEFTGDVIYFDNPSFAPLGYYPSTGLDFSKIVNDGNTNNYDYSVVNTYNTYYPTTYTFDVPYWLMDPSTTPKVYDLPSDYDFQNIQFDYEADASFLDGSGVIQDVYDVLPLKLQNLIILFGAGTCAFIFLRR